MPEKMRARHAELGVVKDVPKTAHYLDNGWSEVDPSTPTTEQERHRALNAVRAGVYDPAEHKAAEVVAVIESAPEVADEVKAAEKSGKGRKTVLDAD